MATKFIVLVALIGLVTANPGVRPTNMEHMIDEMNTKCDSGADSLACVKVRAMRFLDTVMSKDDFKVDSRQLVSDVEVKSNGANSRSARSQGDFLDAIESYISGHDVTVDLPVADAKVTVSSRNLNNDEINLNVKFPGSEVEGKGRKNRLKKIAVPIMVLILLKAMTVIPMAIGILKLKAFNALALGFFSFVVSVGLAIFQLCKKLAAEHHPAHISAHGPWDSRSFVPNAQIESAHNLAYKAYV
ncbi:uncharacterized protein LOC129914958 [Episyrphus balteatus]|uniref:uncharacterized protein LOC129914958 n=1 Tax=Episyrphus balteatus TaxID=286459 RepID=UPI00248598C8|nr:uncharacterized protein LOC129914958 [Episyrphus balteatus]